MADKQPPTVREGATTGDIEEDVPATAAKSAEDRKAAAALSSLDSTADDAASSRNIDQDAVHKAIQHLDALSGADIAAATASALGVSLSVPKHVKIDAADVDLLVDQLDLPKAKATDLLRAHDGDAIEALTAFVTTI